jgi:DNA (cytosine-5)-methyltransferase 1
LLSFYEFFAGGGMARAGLGRGWNCLFANEIDPKKAAIYTANWRPGVLKVSDVAMLDTTDLPGEPDLVWASFPCQDLSLAGGGRGLNGDRSRTFWSFWRLVRAMIREGRTPRMIVIENVCGTLTSRRGKDFAAICSTFANAGYRYGAIIADAVHFVPQSRPRLFVIGVRDDISLQDDLSTLGPPASYLWHSRALLTAQANLPAKARERWIWWNLPAPPPRSMILGDLIEDCPVGVEWHSESETTKLRGMMSRVNKEKLDKAKRARRRMIGAVYKRTRLDERGRKVQRAEIRFDGVAGCLRTPAGGSSRQIFVVVDGKSVRSRLLSARETARLMGLPDAYKLPPNYNEAYHLTGDGVVVPVVRHLARHLFEPLLAQRRIPTRIAA